MSVGRRTFKFSRGMVDEYGIMVRLLDEAQPPSVDHGGG